MDNNTEIVSAGHVRKKTLIAFSFFLLFLVIIAAGWKLLQKQPTDDGALKPLRKALSVNESIFLGMFGNRLAKTFPKASAVQKVRVNGFIGLRDGIDANNWKLYIVKSSGDTISVTLSEIMAMPKSEIVFDFKCIEGWSQVTHWGGVRFSDFVDRMGLTDEEAVSFVGLSTPDNEYYVGIDMKSMLHPQTLLCYEVNGKTLPANNGYPLRLIIPVKYGVKHIKRIGTMLFSNTRPPDYWYERGYDYYCGL